MISTLTDTLHELKAWDDNRDSFTGEHLLTLATGVALLLLASRSRSMVTRSVTTTLGTTLVLRAASGRDGLVKLLPYLPKAMDFRR